MSLMGIMVSLSFNARVVFEAENSKDLDLMDRNKVTNLRKTIKIYL